MTIFGASESDAALLAVSVLLLGDLGEADFTQRLMNFSQGIRNNGVWGNEEEKGKIAKWAIEINYAPGYCLNINDGICTKYNRWEGPVYQCKNHDDISANQDCSKSDNSHTLLFRIIESNVLAWGLSSEVPNFRKYVTDYGYARYGLGVCNEENVGTIAKSTTSVFEFRCEQIENYFLWFVLQIP
jgi:hypothetical protein